MSEKQPDEPKQVIVMRTDLKMRKGKMIAQGAHASMKVFFDRAHIKSYLGGRCELVSGLTWQMRDWVEGIFTKVCLRVESEAELDAIYERALAAGLPAALIVDAGKTEFNGVPTKTCCAIGPAMPEEIDPITGHLKLL
jgi:PTH2 family peptidyl-tRNA hydrolase